MRVPYLPAAIALELSRVARRAEVVRFKTRPKALSICIMLVLFSMTARAECPSSIQPRYNAINLRLDNDVFVRTDHDYTHGMSVALATGQSTGTDHLDCLEGPALGFTSLARKLDADFWREDALSPSSRNHVLWLGQWIYTPRDPQRQDLVATDRPYAGLLMGGFAWNRRRTAPDGQVQVLDSRILGLGFMGPVSLGHTLHVLSHHLTDSEKFRGWGHQVRTEPAFMIGADRAWQHQLGHVTDSGWSGDLTPGIGFRLGNAETSGILSLQARWGSNLPLALAVHPLSKGADGRMAVTATVPERSVDFGIYGFVLGEFKVVAWDFSLDGNWFGSGHKVQRKPWRARAALGFGVQTRLRQHIVRISLMRVLSTRHFAGQASPHGYGALTIELPW